MEQFISNLSTKLDVEVSQPSASSSSTGQSSEYMMDVRSRLSAFNDRYGNHVLLAYTLLSIIGSIVYTRYRQDKSRIEGDTSSKPLNKVQVILWFILFMTPAIIVKYVTN